MSLEQHCGTLDAIKIIHNMEQTLLHEHLAFTIQGRVHDPVLFVYYERLQLQISAKTASITI